MKMLFVTMIAAFSTTAFAQLDVSGCDLATKPGYAICHMTNCNMGETTVATCTVTFKHRQGSSGGDVLPKCDPGQTNYPCVSDVQVKPRPATTPEQQAEFDRQHQQEVDQYNKAGG